MSPGEPSGAAVDAQVEADAIVLAGGGGRRLGGLDKATIRVEGRTLLERLLSGLSGLAGVRGTVVVGPVDVPRLHRDTVQQTVEDPAGGGPVAAVGAGLARLRDAGRTPSQWTLVMAVDQPQADAVATLLLESIGARGGGAPPLDALVPRDDTGRWQWLLAAYRTTSLRAALDALPELRDAPMRRVFGALRVGDVAVDPALLGDIDTHADLERWAPQGPGQWS